MLGLPKSTEFNKRIPKQKFYENIAVTPAMKKAFVEQIRIIYWRNKIAATTLNLAAGEQVTEIEVFEVRLSAPELDESVLRQIARMAFSSDESATLKESVEQQKQREQLKKRKDCGSGS